MRWTMLRFSAMLCVLTAAAVTLLGVWERLRPDSRAATAEGLTIVIDAGHGGFDGGAVGVSGTVEAGLNLAVAQMLAEEFAARGMQTIMTRTDEGALAGTKDGDMQKRKELLHDARADVVVSVHMNIFRDPSVRGTMAYYMQGSEEGRVLAQSVIDAVADATGQKRREANPGDYFVVRECSVPAVLVECGFLSNPEEEALLSDASYQEKLAKAIADGVVAYFDGRQ